jgi:hypothetical protein
MQLASTMAASETNILAIKRKYEADIKSLEEEMDALTKEKEMLMQQVCYNHDC